MIKYEVLSIVEASRVSRKVLSAFNATFVTLIPKEHGEDTPGKFHPIALCNVILKMIMEIIANRLKVLLPILIFPEQDDFVEGRQILDGIITVHKIIHSLKIMKVPGILMKLDLSNLAYYKLRRDFIDRMPRAFEFANNWVNWVWNLVSSAFFSIVVNGTPTQPFKASRGLRQGDPLSPFLFILMMEGLGCLIETKKANREIKGLGLHQDALAQTHQKFVDDTMLMGYSSMQEARTIKDNLNTFL